MQISGSFIRPITQLPVDHQSARERSSAENGFAVQSSAGAVESNLTLRAVREARETESMLFRGRFKQTAYPDHGAIDSRSHRALTAYAALEHEAELT